MKDISKIDYSAFDKPEILLSLFHPRPELKKLTPSPSSEDILIKVEEDITIGARFYFAGRGAPTILFFHGNGEIVADYDDIASIYVKMGVNFFPVDYRGYGRSNGSPTITSMMRDSHIIFEYAKNWLKERNYSNTLVVMGRSLGSACALELSRAYKERFAGLIIESGFAYARPLLGLLGIDMDAMGLGEEEGFRNIDKIRSFDKPTLIIHARNDHIISFTEGQALYDECPAKEKHLLFIPNANHNDIFLRGIREYMKAIKDFIGKIS